MTNIIETPDQTDQWINDIYIFSSRHGVPAPRFYVANKGKTNAIASKRGITVTPDLLSAPDCVRLYVVAHELGHVAKRHYRLSSMSGLALLMSIVIYLEQQLQNPRHLPLSVAFVLLTAAFVSGLYLHNELEADRFAVECIGVEMCLEGSAEMGRLSGTLQHWERRIKLAALRRIARNIRHT